jgi:hypothetical protein
MLAADNLREEARSKQHQWFSKQPMTTAMMRYGSARWENEQKSTIADSVPQQRVRGADTM